MKQLLFLFSAFTVFAFSSCMSDDEAITPKPAELEVVFRAMYDGEPLVLFDEYTINDSTDIQFSRLSMFVNELSLVKGASTYPIDDLRLINFEESNGTNAEAMKGISLSFTELKDGLFDGLTFGLGITAEDNAKAPTEYPAGYLLNDAAEWWQGWKSYVFVKVEGKATLSDSVQDVRLHSGGDEVFRQVVLPKNIVLSEGKTTTVYVDLDAAKIFNPTNGLPAYNLHERSTLHMPAHKPLMKIVSDNWVPALSIH